MRRRTARSRTSGSRSPRQSRILAVASGGGHWVQLLRLRPAFEGCSVTYVTVDEGYRSDVPGASFRVIRDATRWEKWRLAQVAGRLAWILLRERPDVVISTGAAPGYFALRLGKLLGCRTVWLDSIANAEEMSMTGRMVRNHADLWLTQWPHLAQESGATYAGSVL